MIKVSVMYPNSPAVRFDNNYYRDRHMPLIKSRKGAGLKYYPSKRGWRAERQTHRPRMSPRAICRAIPLRRAYVRGPDLKPLHDLVNGRHRPDRFPLHLESR